MGDLLDIFLDELELQHCRLLLLKVVSLPLRNLFDLLQLSQKVRVVGVVLVEVGILLYSSVIQAEDRD